MTFRFIMLYDGVQVSMRATIVRIKDDNRILTFCRPVDVSNIRLQDSQL